MNHRAAIDTISMGPYICPACKTECFSKGMYMHHAKYSATCTPEDRFWARVDKSGRCWLFKGATDKWDYGHVGHGGKRVQAHRYAFLIAKGEIPSGLLVLHNCDTPLCVRPDHLRLGTDKDNTDDKIARRGLGLFVTRSTVTEDQVREIRKLYKKTAARKGNAKDVAAMFGVTIGTIHAIGQGRTWKHVK